MKSIRTLFFPALVSGEQLSSPQLYTKNTLKIVHEFRDMDAGPGLTQKFFLFFLFCVE